MDLQLLTESAAIALYRDIENDWLYIDWRGDLTLRIVKEGCLLISNYFLRGNYTKVLNDNTNVTSLTADVSPWLATGFLPYIKVGGIKCIAWVYAPSLSTQHYTDIALFDLDSPVVALFSDTATACGWLKNAQFRPPASASAKVLYMEKLMPVLQAREGSGQLITALENRIFAPEVSPPTATK